MHTRLQIDFPFTAPLGTRVQQTVQSPVESISQQPRLFLKICTTPSITQEANGSDLFADTIAAQMCLDMHNQRLTASGVTGIQAKLFSLSNPFIHTYVRGLSNEHQQA